MTDLTLGGERMQALLLEVIDEMRKESEARLRRWLPYARRLVTPGKRMRIPRHQFERRSLLAGEAD